MVRAYWVASLDSSFPPALLRTLSRMLQTVSSSTPSSHFPTARSLGNAAGAFCSKWGSTRSSTWDAWNLNGINTARTRYLCKQWRMAQGWKMETKCEISLAYVHISHQDAACISNSWLCIYPVQDMWITAIKISGIHDKCIFCPIRRQQNCFEERVPGFSKG